MSQGGSSDVLKGKERLCRILIQQCMKAELKFDTGDSPVEIQRGVVVYVCFLQGATSAYIELIAKSILQARLSESDDDTPGRKSVLELDDCDVLLIPQATLGGKLKGKNVQYHGIVGKAAGAELFKELVDRVTQLVQTEKNHPSNSAPRVRAGIYGARQILSMETNGPYSHVFDF